MHKFLNYIYKINKQTGEHEMPVVLGRTNNLDCLSIIIVSLQTIIDLQHRILERQLQVISHCYHRGFIQKYVGAPGVTLVNEGSSVSYSVGEMEEYSGKGVVCVTGGTGFIASWLIMRLLEQGYTVRTTVRSNPTGEILISFVSAYIFLSLNKITSY